jgi:hypothetical protein
VSYFGKYRGKSAGKWWAWVFDLPGTAAVTAWIQIARRRFRR